MVDQIGTLKNKKPYFPMMHDNKDLESFCYLLATKFYNHFQRLEDFQKIIFQKQTKSFFCETL